MTSKADRYVAQQVREKRIEKNISQSQLAFELNMSQGFVGSVESGQYGKKYNVEQINKIALILECSPKDFMPPEPLE